MNRSTPIVGLFGLDGHRVVLWALGTDTAAAFEDLARQEDPPTADKLVEVDLADYPPEGALTPAECGLGEEVIEDLGARFCR